MLVPGNPPWPRALSEARSIFDFSALDFGHGGMAVRDSVRIALWKQHYLKCRARFASVVSVRVYPVGRDIQNKASTTPSGFYLQQAMTRLVELEHMLVGPDGDRFRASNAYGSVRGLDLNVLAQEIGHDVPLFRRTTR